VTLRLWESSESWRTAVHRIPNRIIQSTSSCQIPEQLTALDSSHDFDFLILSVWSACIEPSSSKTGAFHFADSDL
jgi:hypothetical protein